MRFERRVEVEGDAALRGAKRAIEVAAARPGAVLLLRDHHRAWAPALRIRPVLMDIEQVVSRLCEEALDPLPRRRVADEIRHSPNAERRWRHVLLGSPR